MIKDIKEIDVTDLEESELDAWGSYALYYFWEVLSGVKDLQTAREDILSFRNSEYYKGSNEKYKPTPTQEDKERE